ncbi:MAG: four helix bundle protein [Acidobacteriota bacterium]
MRGRHYDLEVWQRAMALVRQVYTVTARFTKEELYGMASQMRRAAVSVFRPTSLVFRLSPAVR